MHLTKPAGSVKFVHTTDWQTHAAGGGNLLNRKFNPEALNRAWTSEGITYIRTRSGWLYLAVVMDLCFHAG